MSYNPQITVQLPETQQVSHQRGMSRNVHHIRLHQMRIRLLWNLQETSPEVENRGISCPIKRTCDHQFFFQKRDYFDSQHAGIDDNIWYYRETWLNTCCSICWFRWFKAKGKLRFTATPSSTGVPLGGWGGGGKVRIQDLWCNTKFQEKRRSRNWWVPAPPKYFNCTLQVRGWGICSPGLPRCPLRSTYYTFSTMKIIRPTRRGDSWTPSRWWQKRVTRRRRRFTELLVFSTVSMSSTAIHANRIKGIGTDWEDTEDTTL